MVAQHYRWDFIGLSTDEKPTPVTSEKVVDGSTFYCSDNSKLYVWCDTQWYEKTATGGGGASYTAGTGIDITDNTISVDTDTIQPKLTIAQTTGSSTTDVMSQDATTKMVYPDTFSTKHNVILSSGTGFVQGNYNVVIGNSPAVTANNNVAIGDQSYSNKDQCVLLGSYTNTTGGAYAVALGTYSSAWEKGVVSVGDSSGTHTNLYNNTQYRKIVNVYDGSNAHDVVTVGQVNSLITAINTALNTNIPLIGA